MTKDLEKAMLLNLLNYGRAISDSAAYQLKSGEYNEDTFRGWISDINHILDLPYEEGEESDDNN